MERTSRTDAHAQDPPPDEPRSIAVTVAGLFILGATALAALMLTRAWLDDGPGLERTAPDVLLVVMGWLPVGGFQVMVGLLLAGRARWPYRPRVASGLSLLLVAAWAGVALVFEPGRGGWSEMVDDLRHAGEALARGAEWTLYGLVVSFAWWLFMAGTSWGDRLDGGGAPRRFLVMLLPAPLAVLGVLVVTSL